MSFVVKNDGDKYRGGYASSPVFNSDEIREATSTFENYIGGTFLIIFLVFFTFLILIGITMLLMSYARFMNSRRPRGGFYDMPPMMVRLPIKTASGVFSTLPRSDIMSRKGAMSRQSTTEHSDVL